MKYHNCSDQGKLIRIILILSAALMPTLLYSQSLDSLIREALANNSKLKALKYKAEAAGFRPLSAGSLPAPVLGLEFSEIPIGKYNLWNDAYSVRLSFSQMFMPGGKLSAMSETERINALAETENAEAYKAVLTGQIKMTYYKLWGLERRIEIQKKTNQLYYDQLSSIRGQYIVNRTSQADVIAVNSEIAAGLTELLSYQRQRESELNRLSMLTGRDISSDEIKITLDPQLLLNIRGEGAQPGGTQKIFAETEEDLINNNPALRRMQKMIDMNRSMIPAAEKEGIPDVMLQAMVMRQPQGMFLTAKSDLSMIDPAMAKTEYMFSIMTTVTLPFVPWSSGKYRLKAEELNANVKSLEYERNEMKREMILQLKEAAAKLRSSEDLINLYSKTIMPLYEEAIRIQTASFQSRQSGIGSLIDSFRMHLMHEMNYNMAQADYLMAQAEIEMMTGIQLNQGGQK